MSAALLVNFALLAVVGLGGIAIDRRLRSGARLKALPWYGQLAVGGVAISPITVFADQLAVGPLYGVVVGFVVSIGCWIVLPLVGTQLLDIEPADPSPGC